MKFTLGKYQNKNIDVDIEQLLRSRLLAVANSGGGKSWLLRRIIEQCAGKVQQIVIDVEGEFPSLREKHDFLHVGKGGDINTDVRSAALMAERLLELNASAVIDLYELQHYNRIQYVKIFLDAMVNVRKELWHPCIIYIDEAHIFAPEKGESAALQSVIDIVTRGRKRSFCTVLATQRLSKLHKDTAAELKNVLIGGTTIDIDLKRSNEALGFATKERMFELRNLDPGEFFAFGPAISKEVVRVKIGDVLTTHQDVDTKNKVTAAAAAPEKIRKMLEQLKDLPKEAEEKQKSIDTLKAENKELRRQLAEKPKADPVQIDTEKIIAPVVKEYSRKIALIGSEVQKGNKVLLAVLQQIQGVTDNLVKIDIAPPVLSKPVEYYSNIIPKVNSPQQTKEIRTSERSGEMPSTLGACERAIVGFLYSNNSRDWSKEQVGIMIGYSPTSGGFNNAISKLNVLGLVKRSSGKLIAGDAPLPAGIDTSMDFSIDNIRRKLGRCENEILRVLIDNVFAGAITKEQVAAETLQPSGIPYSPGSGGFNNSISRLSTLGLLERVNGKVKLSEDARELI